MLKRSSNLNTIIILWMEKFVHTNWFVIFILHRLFAQRDGL